jgi:hypothetical protein
MNDNNFSTIYRELQQQKDSLDLYISREEFSVAADYHFHEGLALEELDMSCAPDEGIEVFVTDLKVHIQSI